MKPLKKNKSKLTPGYRYRIGEKLYIVDELGNLRRISPKKAEIRAKVAENNNAKQP